MSRKSRIVDLLLMATLGTAAWLIFCRKGVDVSAFLPLLAFFPARLAIHKILEDYQGKLSITTMPDKFFDDVAGDFRLINAGDFLMGNRLPTEKLVQKYGGSSRLYDDAQGHRVWLSKPFYMAKYETTRARFAKFVKATGYKTTAEEKGESVTWRNPGFNQQASHPVVCVSWYDAMAYIDWLNQNAKYSWKLKGTPLYRLPTEAEWEYACRAGTETEFFWGDEPKAGEGYCNCLDRAAEANIEEANAIEDGYPFTSPVSSMLRSNPWKLYDMAGNVCEWCSDWYREYEGIGEKNPTGPTEGKERVLRGGSWKHLPRLCRSAARKRAQPECRFNYVGFRIVLERRRAFASISKYLRRGK